jgi:putative oxidoreductase
MGALYASHYLWVIFAFQVISCASAGQPLRTVGSGGAGPVIVNILFFHALMAPSGFPLALFVAVLWALIFADVRLAFAGLFQPRWQPRA